ncbi:MAG: GTP 3',8-cyclase MoaA [Bacteroidota bacterium]
MYDRFNRKINYLRISVTDRCNLRCTYCMPEEGVTLKNHRDILSFEEIMAVVGAGVKLGINKIRLTGGEPLVRKDIAGLVEQIIRTEGITDVGLTTNGTLLRGLANELREAGLKRLNISLDTLNSDKYTCITRKGRLDEVLEGIETAIRLGFDPIKINFVRIRGVNEDDEALVREFCREKGLSLRLIRQMNLAEGEFYPVEGGSGGVCKVCNRFRLTADGYIVPCLFSDYGYSIREMGIEQAFNKALNIKPESGETSVKNHFYSIGG